MHTLKKYYLLKQVVIICFLSLICITAAYSQKYTEYEVKAVFLVNFAKFVQWPDNNEKSTFVFGIYGNDPFEGIFENPSFKQTKIQGKSYEVVYFNSISDIDCDILFISGIEKYEMIQVITHIQNLGVLSVGDNLIDFCEKGGMINFTEKGTHYRFEINNNAALHSQIKISSKLLNLAKIIKVDEIKF